MKLLTPNTKYQIQDTGFTLIELLVVVSLIGVLATLLFANLNAARERGRDAQRKADSRNIQTALRLYYNDYKAFPASDTSGNILGCGAAGTSVCTKGQAWTAGSNTYMPVFPGDPLSTQSYNYTRTDPDTFSLKTCLENKSDTQGRVATGAETSWCTSAWVYEVKS